MGRDKEERVGVAGIALEKQKSCRTSLEGKIPAGGSLRGAPNPQKGFGMEIKAAGFGGSHLCVPKERLEFGRGFEGLMKIRDREFPRARRDRTGWDGTEGTGEEMGGDFGEKWRGQGGPWQCQRPAWKTGQGRCPGTRGMSWDRGIVPGDRGMSLPTSLGAISPPQTILRSHNSAIL